MSIETVKLVNALAQAVRVEDWLGEAVETKRYGYYCDAKAVRKAIDIVANPEHVDILRQEVE